MLKSQLADLFFIAVFAIAVETQIKQKLIDVQVSLFQLRIPSLYLYKLSL